MAFINKMYHDVAKEIINNIFWKKYQHILKDNFTWYQNLNNFILKEWYIIQESEEKECQFNNYEEELIICDAMDILMDKLNIDEDELKEHEEDVNWRRFNDIISYYICKV